MRYNMFLLLGIKLYELSVGFVEIKLDSINENEEEITEIINIIKIPQYVDYNHTPIFYLRSSLGSNLFVQMRIEDKNKLTNGMTHMNILMKITNSFLPNFSITYIG
jgi:hypothetical protein